MTQRIGIFGGTFDPPHAGHLHVVLAALEAHCFERLIVAPTSQNPWKSREATPLSSRCEMLRLLFSSVGLYQKAQIEISSLPYMYTHEFVERWRLENPDDELIWIIGEDLRMRILDWKKWNQLGLKLLIIPQIEGHRSTLVRERLSSPHPSLEQFVKDAALYNM